MIFLACFGGTKRNRQIYNFEFLMPIQDGAQKTLLPEKKTAVKECTTRVHYDPSACVGFFNKQFFIALRVILVKKLTNTPTNLSQNAISKTVLNHFMKGCAQNSVPRRRSFDSSRNREE